MNKLELLKKEVYEANMMLPKHNLVTFTWGNVSGILEGENIMVIKPSGVNYEDLSADKMVVVDINTGKKIEGSLSPSSDTNTHIKIYKEFSDIKGITHTHSRWATIYSQMCVEILPFGTTHADYFFDSIPITRQLTKDEIGGDYEYETGKVIVETFVENKISPTCVPGVLVSNHGPFTFGKSAIDSVHNSVVLEEVAFMAWHTQKGEYSVKKMQPELLNKHYLRKHGQNAYYGQK